MATSGGKAVTGPFTNLAAEIAAKYRPYSVRFAVDLMVSASLWVALYLFKLMTNFLSIDGWAGELIRQIHAAGTVAAFAVFATLFIVDVYVLHRRQA
jgi:hypothetical protein